MRVILLLVARGCWRAENCFVFFYHEVRLGELQEGQRAQVLSSSSVFFLMLSAAQDLTFVCGQEIFKGYRWRWSATP